MQTFVGCLHEALEEMEEDIEDDDYRRVVGIYLGLWLSRNSMRMSTVGAWHVKGEKLEKPFEGARLSMKWDYPETNPFSGVTGGFRNQVEWITKLMFRECSSGAVCADVSRGDAASLRLLDATVDATVTDPPISTKPLTPISRTSSTFGSSGPSATWFPRPWPRR
jgi:adenine-specific DNA methylase